MDAPIQSLITKVDTLIGSVASTAAAGISGVLTPIMGTFFGIYIILICVNFFRGASSAPVWDIYLRAAGFAIIIGIGLSAEGYVNNVIPIIQTLGDDLAKAASGAEPNATGLDQLAINYTEFLHHRYILYQEMPWYNFGGAIENGIIYFATMVLVCISLVPFLVFATALLIMAKVGTVLVAAVGPIFFACLIFPATRQYFSAWLNSLFSYALIPVFLAIVAMIAVNISKSTFEEANMMTSDEIIIKLIFIGIVNLILIVLIKLCSSLASSLSAGGINAGSPAGAYGSMVRGGTYTGNLKDGADRKVLDAPGKAWGYTKEKVAAARDYLRRNNIRPG